MAVQAMGWGLIFGVFILILLEIVSAQGPRFTRPTSFGGFGPQARFRQRQGRIPQRASGGRRLPPNVLFGTQFRGRGPGSRLAPGIQRRPPFGAIGRPSFGSGRFGLRDDVTFLGDLQSRRRPENLAVTNPRFQGFRPQNMMLREAHQPLHASARIRSFRDRTRSWRQPASRSRGRIPVNPEVVRQGFVRRFTGQRQSADISRRQPQVVNNRQPHAGSLVPQSGRHAAETHRQIAARENPNIRRVVVTSHDSQTISSQPGRIPTDQSSAIRQSPQIVSQASRPLVTRAKATIISPGLASTSHTASASVIHTVPQSASHQFVRPIAVQTAQASVSTQHVKPQMQHALHVASDVSQASKIQSPQHVVSNAQTVPGTVVSSVPVAQPKTIVAPIVISPKIVPVAPQVVQSTEVKTEPSLEEDLQLINAIVALLQAAGSNLQLTVPAAAPVHPPSHATQGQFSRAMYPGMISPWMGAPLGSIHYQELMFGDTTDPADILATTTAAPNITVGNMSEPLLNVSIVTAAVKVAAPEQIPAPQGEGVTPVPVSEVPVSTAPTEVVKLKAENSIKTEIKIDAKIRKEVPTLKLEPLPETLVRTEPATETLKHETTQKLAGIEVLKAKGLDLIKIVSDALTAASYPTNLHKALIKELSNILAPKNETNPVTEVVVETKSSDVVPADVSTPKIQTKNIITTQSPIEVDIVTDRLPTAADLGIVLKDIPIEATTKSPSHVKVKAPKVVVLNPEIVSTVRKIVKDIVANEKNGEKSIVSHKTNDNFVSKYEGGPSKGDKTVVIVKDVTIENSVKEIPLNSDGAKIELTPSGLVKESNAEEIIAYPKVELKTTNKVKVSETKEVITHPKVELKTSDAMKESKAEEVITHPKVELKTSDAMKESKAKEVMTHPKVELKTSDAMTESKAKEVITHPKVELKKSDAMKESKAKEVITHPKVELKTSDAMTESKAKEVMTYPKVELKKSDAMKESKAKEVMTHPKVELKTSDAMTESKAKGVMTHPKVEFKTSDAMTESKAKEVMTYPKVELKPSASVKETSVKDVTPLLKVEVKPLDMVKESKAKEFIAYPRAELNPIDLVSERAKEVTAFAKVEVKPSDIVKESKAKEVKAYPKVELNSLDMVSESKVKEVTAFAKVEVKHSDIGKEPMSKEVVAYPTVVIKPLDLMKQTKVNEIVALPTVELNPSEIVKESKPAAAVYEPTVESKPSGTMSESKLNKVEGLPIFVAKGDTVNTIEPVKAVGKPAFEIVLESLVTQSGGGVEFLSRPVHSVDPTIVNQLTAVPKLASVENKDFTREPLFPEPSKVDSKVEIASKNDSRVSVKAVESNADKGSAAKSINISANIPKGSILQQIDLASLAKELSSVSNGTDITQYLSDPLFVKVLEDIVTQTLSVEANKPGKKNRPKPKTKPTTTVKPKVSTEEIEIELEDIVTTTASPTSTSVDIMIESTTTSKV